MHPTLNSLTTHTVDVAIVGGGLVGASLALALRTSGLDGALVEANGGARALPAATDERVTALSLSSQRILDGLGLWSALSTQVRPIRHIHVSSAGHWGVTRIDATDEGVPALGHVVENHLLGRQLERALAGLPRLHRLQPARVVAIDHRSDHVALDLDTGERICARLVVAADGARSRLRELLGIPTLERDYGQRAVVATVSTSDPPRDRAFERFTDSGPLAMLPLTGNRASVVWTRPSADPDLSDIGQPAFLAALQRAFGYRLGRLTAVGRIDQYPLRLVVARQARHGRVVLLGNSAHALHPVAGQGFNLSLRDAAALAEHLAAHHTPGALAHIEASLDAFLRSRMRDQRRVVWFTDGLARYFRGGGAVGGGLRGLALSLVDTVPALRHGLAQISMGLTPPVPRLARGAGLPDPPSPVDEELPA